MIRYQPGDAVFSQRFGKGFVSEVFPGGLIIVRFDKADPMLHGGDGMRYSHLMWEGHFWGYNADGTDRYDKTLRHALPTDPPSSVPNPDGTITAELNIDDHERY